MLTSLIIFTSIKLSETFYVDWIVTDREYAELSLVGHQLNLICKKKIFNRVNDIFIKKVANITLTGFLT